MPNLKNGDDATLQKIMEYIETLMPGIGVVMMFYDNESKMMRPATNMDFRAATELAAQCVMHMQDTPAQVHEPLAIQ